MTNMKTSYETKLEKYRATCINMARLEVLTLKFYVASGAPNTAALFAMRAARWYFSAYPEAREVMYHDYLVSHVREAS